MFLIIVNRVDAYKNIIILSDTNEIRNIKKNLYATNIEIRSCKVEPT